MILDLVRATGELAPLTAWAVLVAVVILAVVALCALVGIVDRLAEPARLRAEARLKHAKADLVRAERERTPAEILADLPEASPEIRKMMD